MAAVLVLSPIFEADLAAEQYAYRPGRGALDAVQHVHRLLMSGHTEVVDADLSGYFDTIPHAELLKSVARRVVDGAMLHLPADPDRAREFPADGPGEGGRTQPPAGGLGELLLAGVGQPRVPARTKGGRRLRQRSSHPGTATSRAVAGGGLAPPGWLRAKYPHQGYGRARYPAVYLHEVLGLVRLQGRPRNFPWATA